MLRIFSLSLSALFLGAAFPASPALAATPSKPNIVIFLADDMGFSDLGCFGGELETPNLDALASRGLRFTQFYNSARCSPTRAALLTGLDPHQTGVGVLANDARPGGGSSAPADAGPGYIQYLNDRCVTLAEVLKPAGYRTYMTGKWHIGAFEQSQWPLGRGFERFYGVLAGTVSYFRPSEPRPLLEGSNRLPAPTDPNYYTTDAFGDHAVTYLREHDARTPFLLYFAFNAPHYPLHARQADIAKFVGRFRAGWDKLREERFARQRKMGLFDHTVQLSPRDESVRAWDTLTAEQKTQLDYRMAVYAAMVYRMDLNVGRVVTTLRERGMLENTLILFLSDNGASAEPGPDLGGGDFANINDPEKRGQGGKDGSTYGAGWANLSNTPFRRFKTRLHEGGIATSMIAHWPAGIKTKPGTITAVPAYLTDVMPTVLEVTGASYAAPTAKRDAGALFPLEGSSLVPVFTTGIRPTREWFFWEQYDNRAVRRGNWKAVSPAESNGQWELYNLDTDRTELRNVAAQNPNLVEELSAAWTKWANTHQVLPKSTGVRDESAPKKKKKKQ